VPRPTELHRLDEAKVKAFSPSSLAVLVEVEGEDYWFPFSQIREPDELDIRASRGLTIEMVVPAWMAKEKGLI